MAAWFEERFSSRWWIHVAAAVIVGIALALAFPNCWTDLIYGRHR